MLSEEIMSKRCECMLYYMMESSLNMQRCGPLIVVNMGNLNPFGWIKENRFRVKEIKYKEFLLFPLISLNNVAGESMI